MSWLEVRDLSLRIAEARQPERALVDQLSFGLEPGQSLGIVGPNGAGKSTLLRLLSGYTPASAGQVLLAGSSLHKLPVQERARLLAVVNPREDLPPFRMDVRAYLRLGRAPWQDWLGSWKPADEAALAGAITRTGVAPLLDEALNDLSSGEWQRVQLARALCQTPRLLLLDEPTSHLDVGAQLQVMRQLRTLCREGLALICVIHDLNLAAQYMDTLLLMHRGRLVAAGSPAEVLSPELLAEAYAVPLGVTPHPRTGRPLLFPDYD